MRLPFPLHRPTKSTDGFVQMPVGSGSGSGPGDAPGRDRGASVGASSLRPARPASGVFAQAPPVPPPPSDVRLTQLEEELDTIMDAMGLVGDQRMAMKNMPVERKMQLVRTHKASRGSARPDATPLSEHLKILARAGAQSLPRARLEKLRVDISYQTIDQIAAFIDGGGVRLLLTRLAELNERRAAARRSDELQKELEILRCVLGIAKVPDGACALVDSGSGPDRLLDSLATAWLPCAVVCLRTVSVLVHHDDAQCAAAAYAALFRHDAAASASATAPAPAKRRPAFAEWMDKIDAALAAFGTADVQARADMIELAVASLALINTTVDSLAPSIAKRVKLYERLAAHDMLRKLASLRAWNVAVIASHLNRWDEVLRRDYNIARAPRPDAAAGAADPPFAAFVAHYEEARAAAAAANDASLYDNDDDDDEYLHMNLATYAAPQDGGAAGGTARVVASAPVTPAAGAVPRAAGVAGPSNNPFFPAAASGTPSPAGSVDSKQHQQQLLPPMPSWGSSGIVAETGSLRDLRSPKGARPQLPPPAAEPLASIKSAHSLLQRSLADAPHLAQSAADAACQDLRDIVRLAQSLMETLGRSAAAA
ncbi:hypothetical protein H4R18_002708 [Coemansia javaensis]|uniref:Formin GTPase-binding domain-containing protein n=1 Tax=Coemansia javaensis TaxID=2761396 RepID=A0A9W8LIC1_9FUNG|nr:hypothetical protein H4R18_002708 [Coemansia javaensis]